MFSSQPERSDSPPSLNGGDPNADAAPVADVADNRPSSYSAGSRRRPSLAIAVIVLGALGMAGIIAGVIVYAVRSDTSEEPTTAPSAASVSSANDGPATTAGTTSLAPAIQTTKAPSAAPVSPAGDTGTFVPSLAPITPTVSPIPDTTSSPSSQNEPAPSIEPATEEPATATEEPTTVNPTFSPTAALPTAPPEIELGTAGGIEYYHCESSPAVTVDHHIVLLHGAAFTKEDWLDVGILDLFCSSSSSITATALDLPISAGHEELQDVLNALVDGDQVSLPVVLVTPSASGFSVVDWLTSGDNDISEQVAIYLDTWVPVATGSLSRASDEEIVDGLGDLPVLAIYGDEDMAGGRLSRRLGDLVGAKVVELPGGHPVYLQSPGEFVQEILSFLSTMSN